MEKIIQEIINNEPFLQKKAKGIPFLGKRQLNEQFSEKISIVNDAIDFCSRKTKEYNDLIDKNLPKHSFSSGDPLKCKPFYPCIKEIKKILKEPLYSYPSAMGLEKHRKIIMNYLIKEGFVNEKNKEISPFTNGLTIDNIAFTMSTTHAYNLILETILKPYDVVIVPGPNYSFFDFVPERLMGFCEIIDLSEDDDWKINVAKLKKFINKKNKELKEKYKNLNYIPRVKAFLNCNPSNPLGKSLGVKDLKLLNDLIELANKYNFFIIDDLVYRDICYSESEMAIPVATLGKHFSNVITINGLSKCYGLAALRAGFVVADEVIIRQLQNKIFQQMDSYPIIQSAALIGAFNDYPYRYKYYNKYFRKIRREYVFRYNLVVALVNGIDTIKDKKLKQRISKTISYYTKDSELIKDGIKEISLLNNCKPNGGFFVLLDFSLLKNKTFKNITITDDKKLLQYFYIYKNVKFLIGSSLGYFIDDKLIGRITFALSPKELVESFVAIKEAIQKLQ